jgi:hypothetical protein
VNTKKQENWCQKHLADQLLPQLLEKGDNELAQQALQACQGLCRHGCGKKLHRSDYKRKPRGGPSWPKRLSYCCAECRRRMTPPSMRFLGRKVYPGFIVVLMAAMHHGLSPDRVHRLREALGIDRRTLRHWREWWLGSFVQSSFWKAARARLMPLACQQTMPLSLWLRFATDARRDRLSALLKFLAPFTTTSAPETQAM